MENQTWLSKILSAVAGWFSKASPEIHDGAIIATNIVNVIKKAEESNIGQIVETGLEMVIPASTGLVNAFKLYLPTLLAQLNWLAGSTKSTTMSLEVVLEVAAQYLKNVKTVNPDVYAAQLNSLNALIQKWISDNTGTGLTMPQALINPQAVYNPNLVVNIPSVDVTDASNLKTIEAPGNTTMTPEIQKIIDIYNAGATNGLKPGQTNESSNLSLAAGGSGQEQG